MTIKDYQEYLMLYNNPSYESSYFEGYEAELEKFKKIINSHNHEELHNFISSITGKSKLKETRIGESPIRVFIVIP